MKAQALKPEEYYIREEPYYEPVADEITVFEAAYRNQLPVLLKGPTGCGKSRFVEHMAWRLKGPLITVSCHDDLTASDLVGRFLVAGGETVVACRSSISQALTDDSETLAAVNELSAAVF